MTEDHGLPRNRSMKTACDRESLVEAIAAFLAHQHMPGTSEILTSLVRVIDDAGPNAIDSFNERWALASTDWCYYGRDPLVRHLHHVFADDFLPEDLVVLGTQHLAGLADKPVVIFTNHLSYSDAHVLEYLLHKFGAEGLANRLTVLAGPKVYSSIDRRFSSLCFGTIKTPQSSTRSTDEAVMCSREVARLVRRSLQVAQERLRLGDALLVFAEGTRSRSGQMQQLLSGAARYLQSPNTWVLPIGITGTERLLPISENILHPVPITLSIGAPIQAGVLSQFAQGTRQLLMDCVGFAIADLLPHEYRGFYGKSVGPYEQARRFNREAFQ